MPSIARSLTTRGSLLSLCAVALVHCSGDDNTNPPVTPGTDAGQDVSAEAGPGEGSAGEGASHAEATVESGGSQEAGDAVSGDAGSGLNKIQHVLVIYMENWSFDSLYGEFAGAENLSSTAVANAPKQLDPSGVIYTTLPQIEPTLGGGGDAGALGPDGGPLSFANAPFALEPYVTTSSKTIDLVHRFYQEQMQINGGALNNFVSVSDAKGMVMGYFHTSGLPLAGIAAQYTLCDHFFHAAFGGSFLNHQWLIAAASPTFPNAPPNVVAQPVAEAGVPDSGIPLLARDPVTGLAIGDGFVTPDGYAVNTSYSVNSPHPPTTAPAQLVPNQSNPTIGDRLSDKGVSWAWYSGGWNDALAYTAIASDAGLDAAAGSEPGIATAAGIFQYHHQPFIYYQRYADGTQAKADHLKDEDDLNAAIQAGTLPAVSFFKPVGVDNEHPNYTNVITGENHIKSLIQAIQAKTDLWNSTAIIITYDENGGFWDHVPPPVVDRWGPGTRVPTIIISPYAKKGFVDKTPYDTTSILAFIEKRFGLQALSTRDGLYLSNGHDLTGAFDFSQTP